MNISKQETFEKSIEISRMMKATGTPGVVEFLPSAVLKYRVSHLQYPTQKLYVYMCILDGRIMNYEMIDGSLHLVIAIPFNDGFVDISLVLPVIKWESSV